MSTNTLTPVSVIIPTTCERVRWDALERAIGGVLSQQGVATQVIAVVNGKRYDADCLEALKRKEGVTVLYRSTGSAPLAQAAGREAVSTPFFAFLDDDDEYLPGALAIRLAPLLADPALDFVVTDGYRALGGRDELAVGDQGAIAADPIGALCKRNWMASCAGLFRTRSVTPDYFADPAPYMEWTYLAFRLAGQLRMRWLDTPTYRINDSPASLSKSEAYLESELDILRRVLALPLPAPVRGAVRRKLGRACHVFAEQSRGRGRLAQAWRFHLDSLVQPGGWRYLAYSRKLLQDLWRTRRARA
jgi:glycosyltransferase involved in cell wall biosynthesis